MPGDAFEQVGVRAIVEGVGQYISDAGRVNSATEGIGRSAQKTAVQTESFGKSLQSLGSRMREAGTTATLLGTALAAPGVAAVKMAVDFNTAITRISTLSGVAEGDLDSLRAGIDRISGETAQGPQALAEALLAITSTGLEGAQALDVLEVSAKGAALGLGDATTIGRLLTGTLKAYEKQGLTAARATDILFATVREGGAEADEVAGSLGRVTGIAAQFGVSMEQVGAFVATFTRLGIGADEAVTALRGSIQAIFAPAKETEKALEGAGLSAKQLQQVVQQQGLVAGLELLVTTFKGNSEAIADVIPNVRALAGVLGTAGSQAQGYQQVLQAITNSQDDFNKAFAQLQETPGFQVQQAIADLQRALIDLGANGLPVLIRVIDVITQVIDKFQDLPEPVQTAILAFSVIGGGMLAFVGAAAYVVGSITTLTSAFISLGGAAGIANLAIAAGPVGLAILGVAAVGAGIGYVFLRDKIADANKEAEHAKEIADATALAQKGTVDEISTRIQYLQTLIAGQQIEVDYLDRTNKLTAEQKVRRDELKASIKAESDELSTLANASDIARTAQDLSVKQIEDAISATEDQIKVAQHRISVIDQENKSAALSLDQHKANKDAINQLTGEIESNESALARLHAALGIATQREKELAAAGQAAGAGVGAAGAQADLTSRGIFKLGTEAGATAEDLSKLTVEAAATAAALQIIERIRQGISGQGFLGIIDIARDIQSITAQAQAALKVAEQIRGFSGGLATAFTHGLGQLTAAEESAAKAAGSAADKAANEAERAAEEASRAAEQAAEDAARAAQQAAEEAGRNAQRIAQETAAATEKAVQDAAAAMQRIVQAEVQALDQLGSLIITALRRQAQQELDAALSSIKAERDARQAESKATIDALEKKRDAAVNAAETARDAAVKNAEDSRDREIAAIEATRDAQIASLREQTDARVAALQAQLDILDQQATADRRAQLQRNLDLAFEPEDRAKAQQDIRDFERQQLQQSLRDQIQQIQDSAKDEQQAIEDQADAEIDARKKAADAAIELAKDTADAKIDAAKKAADAAIAEEQRSLDAALAAFDEQEAAARATYAAMTDEWALQSRARVLVMQGEIKTIGQLLDNFVPEWRAAGLSFGEAIKQGLDASNVADYIRGVLSGVPNPDTGVTPAETDRQAQIAGLEELGRSLVSGGAPQSAIDAIAQDIIDLGAVPQFNNASVQSAQRQEEIRARQEQGKALKAGGAPESTLEDLRQSLIALGAIPEFRTGLDMGMVRRPLLASLDPGEVVLNRMQQAMLGGGSTFEAEAFRGMFEGASFTGTPEDNAAAIRDMLESFFEENIARGAHRVGY